MESSYEVSPLLVGGWGVAQRERDAVALAVQARDVDGVQPGLVSADSASRPPGDVPALGRSVLAAQRPLGTVAGAVVGVTAVVSEKVVLCLIVPAALTASSASQSQRAAVWVRF